jgi:hypothetical protein
MKRIIAASVTTMLLCSGSMVYAQQQGSAPAQQPPVATSPVTAQPPAAAQTPAIDVKSLAPNQREYLVTALMSQSPAVTPDQLAKVRQSYEQLPTAQQVQMAQQIATGIQQLPQDKRDKILNGMPSQ